MTIDCSLDNFRYPGLPTYGINFGVKKTSGEGLSTAECCDDMAMPFNRQRPYIVTETSDTTELEANSVFKITAADITLTIEDAVFDGCTAIIVNNSTGTVTIKGGVSGLNGKNDSVSLAKDEIAYLIYHSGWQVSYITYGGHVSAPEAAVNETHLVRKKEHDKDIADAKDLNNATNILDIARGGTGCNNSQDAADTIIGKTATDTATKDSEYLVKSDSKNVKRITISDFWAFLTNKIVALKVNNAANADYATQAGKAANADYATNADYAAQAGKVLPPIGFVYIQFQGQSDPNSLFGGGTWQNISSNYAGKFFRAEGGDAAAFGSSQAEGLPNITGKISGEYISLFSDLTTSGAFTSPINKTKDCPDGRLSVKNCSGFSFSASNSNSIYGASSHVTPVNTTIRIWKRTA